MNELKELSPTNLRGGRWRDWVKTAAGDQAKAVWSSFKTRCWRSVWLLGFLGLWFIFSPFLIFIFFMAEAPCLFCLGLLYFWIDLVLLGFKIWWFFLGLRKCRFWFETWIRVALLRHLFPRDSGEGSFMGERKFLILHGDNILVWLFYCSFSFSFFFMGEWNLLLFIIELEWVFFYFMRKLVSFHKYFVFLLR